VRRAATLISALVGVASATVTLLLAYTQWFPHATGDGKVAIGVLSGYVATLFVLLVWREWTYATKSRYAEILGLMNQSFLILQELTASTTATATEIRLKCTHVVTNLAKAFSLTTATNCSVCIKLIEVDQSLQRSEGLRPKVRTLCRNDDAEKRRREADAASVDHWLDQNSDFYELHKNAGTLLEHCFLANNLPSLRGYNNSSFELYGRPGGTLLLSRVLPTAVPWPLPYKSTIVVPISIRTGNEYQLSGYLCVDSKSRGAFSRRYDPEILAGFGECLYEVVRRYCNLIEAESNKEAQ
jgi:hypothetical protein